MSIPFGAALALRWALFSVTFMGNGPRECGAGITFVSFGWLGLLIGIVLFGVGVVFLGMVGAGFVLDEPEIAWSLLVMSILAFAARFGGFYLTNFDESLLPEEDVGKGNQRIVTWLR